ncbi:hypothetical protein P7K49_005275 [Saguinus oedipus]|uniref:Uncharacterized protein n=1 Tax=Saguinus oedipus TaxID=9490 RepID=A0ABQ9WC87_SAGOE|nr:hypothetical protein P7K49_005275 [Saguinus oedipus]
MRLQRRDQDEGWPLRVSAEPGLQASQPRRPRQVNLAPEGASPGKGPAEARRARCHRRVPGLQPGPDSRGNGPRKETAERRLDSGSGALGAHLDEPCLIVPLDPVSARQVVFIPFAPFVLIIKHDGKVAGPVTVCLLPTLV